MWVQAPFLRQGIAPQEAPGESGTRSSPNSMECMSIRRAELDH